MQSIKAKLSQKQNEDGFTLIEILVVVTIMGILLAIAVPTFVSQRKNSVDDLIRSDINNIVDTINSVRANNPNAQFVVYKNKKICAGALAAPTSCSATAPSPIVGMDANYLISGGASGSTGGAYYVSGWHATGNQYTSSANRLIYSSDSKSFNS